MFYLYRCGLGADQGTTAFLAPPALGRKLRYDVHPKLVGFMPPNTTHETASEEARQDLFESLFGRSSS